MSDSEHGVTFSYPLAVANNSCLFNRRASGNYDVSEVYTKCKDQEKTIINYGIFDSFQCEDRVSIVALPIFDQDVFQGAVIWESLLNVTIKEAIVPLSFTEMDYPFM